MSHLLLYQEWLAIITVVRAAEMALSSG